MKKLLVLAVALSACDIAEPRLPASAPEEVVVSPLPAVLEPAPTYLTTHGVKIYNPYHESNPKFTQTWADFAEEAAIYDLEEHEGLPRDVSEKCLQEGNFKVKIAGNREYSEHCPAESRGCTYVPRPTPGLEVYDIYINWNYDEGCFDVLRHELIHQLYVCHGRDTDGEHRTSALRYWDVEYQKLYCYN